MKARPHEIVTITESMLIELGACGVARSKLRRLLPAHLSTDPSDNLELAIEVMRVSPECCVGCRYPAWLVDNLIGSSELDTLLWDYKHGEVFSRPGEVMVAQQALAWCADALATRARAKR